MRSEPSTRLRAWGAVAILVVAIALGATAGHAEAQTELDERVLNIERQLLCPQCTNLRLDVCETQICIDMRAAIRERVVQGQSDQEIIDYFTGRYGDRVLADVPREGFNLWLFAWVGGSIVLVAALGTYVLVRLRRTATPSPATITPAEERWLDEQLSRDGERGG
jgi:cytochrome c-type biogenesis protein CcmH